MIVDMIIFGLMTLNYKYVDAVNKERDQEDLPLPEARAEKVGIDNLDFKNEEEQMTTTQW